MLGKQLHITSSEDILTPETFAGPHHSEHASIIKKPARGTGLWTSSWREETKDSAWVEWCRDNGFGDPYTKNWQLFMPLENIKLFVVDSTGDFHRLLRNYGYKDAKMESYGIRGTCIDFVRMSQEYDGIWLTEQGNEKTHLSYPDNLNGWDVESVLWLRWCFSEVQKIETPQPVMVEE